ncbi:MAG: adenylate/guanylate cyclase domain-containing protein [Planctomycetota bacterium]|jgi:TolB-like protein/class 3 adenylate cyclase
MVQKGFKRKLTAILSADAVEYSRLMGEDEEATVRTITAYREVLTTLIQQHNGKVLDSPGDNLLAEFVSVVDAVQCAVAVQKEIKARNDELPENRRMQFRIGINLGDVIEEEERIYGDGVNIAARIETLAVPGGVSISRTVYNQVRSKLKFGYEYQGEHSVKNIAEPVRVYRVLTDPEDAGKIIGEEKPKPWRLAVISVVVVLVLFLGGLTIWNFFLKPSLPPRDAVSEKVSIAVLPFDNMSNDPEQEYFSNGISDDLITDLSKIPNFLVISRNTSFAYRGKSVTIEKIAKELDVRYVLEGSVQKANNLVRINAQLIDATTGHHLWADRYDGNIRDIFALQDKITQKIAASLAVKLTDDEQDRLAQVGTNNIEAYEAFLKGSDLANYLNMDPDGFFESVPWFEKAIQLDPDFSRAYAALAESYVRGAIVGFHRKLKISRRLAIMRAFNYLRISMKNPTNTAYRNIARLYIYQRQHEKAVDHAARAIALDPNNANSNSVMALTLISSGRPDEAVDFSERMHRIDPACLF